MKEFMIYEMTLFKERLQGEQRGIQIGRTVGTKTISIKMFRKGKSFDEIQEFTDLPIQRLEQLAIDNGDG